MYVVPRGGFMVSSQQRCPLSVFLKQGCNKQQESLSIQIIEWSSNCKRINDTGSWRYNRRNFWQDVPGCYFTLCITPSPIKHIFNWLSQNWIPSPFFDKNSSKVITYSSNNATKLPWKKMKFHTFLKEDSSFKFIEDPSQSEPMSSLPNPSPLLFSKFHNKVSTLSKHPQGSICKYKSVPDSLVQLLMSNNVNYEHFRKHKNQEDILDVLGYLTELISSYSDKPFSYFI